MTDGVDAAGTARAGQSDEGNESPATLPSSWQSMASSRCRPPNPSRARSAGPPEPDAGDHEVVGEGAPHHRPRPHHDVPPEHRAGEDDHTGSQPTAAADQDRDVVRPLGVHHLVRVEVAVILVGDVHVRSGVDVVPDLHLEMADDVTPPPDHAPVADADHRIGDHLLAGHHAGGDAHVWTHEGCPVPTRSSVLRRSPRAGKPGSCRSRTSRTGWPDGCPGRWRRAWTSNSRRR